MAEQIAGVADDGEITWPLTFPLRRPIRAMDEDYTAITLQEPTANHAIKYGLLTRGLSEDNISDLLTDLTGIPTASLNKMAGADLIKIATVLGRFLHRAAD